MRRLLAAVPLGLVGVLAVEGYLAATAEYLPVPDYVVEATVGSGGGSPVERVELVVLGDSTVAGIGSPSAEDSLAVLVADRVAAQAGRAVHVIGYGVSGALTEDVRTDQLPKLVDGSVDVLLIVIGSNDATHVTPPWAMASHTRELLLAARDAVGPDSAVVLGGIPQFTTVPALGQPLRWAVGRYAGLLRERQRSVAADLGVPFVDIAALASPRFVGVPDAMSSDGFHPAPTGYGFWADALAPAVAGAIAAEGQPPSASR